MVDQIIGVDQDVIQIYDHKNVEEVGEHFVHETLKS